MIIFITWSIVFWLTRRALCNHSQGDKILILAPSVIGGSFRSWAWSWPFQARLVNQNAMFQDVRSMVKQKTHCPLDYVDVDAVSRWTENSLLKRLSLYIFDIRIRIAWPSLSNIHKRSCYTMESIRHRQAKKEYCYSGTRSRNACILFSHMSKSLEN